MILLVRHGETAWDEGQTEKIGGFAPVPLDTEGRKEAREIASAIAKEYNVRTILTSDIKRAKQTAEYIHATTRASLAVVKGLRPWDAGIYTGREESTLRGVLQTLATRRDKSPKDGESINDFLSRYLSFMRKTLDREQDSKDTLVLVSHSRNQNVAEAWIKEGMPKKFNSDFGAILRPPGEHPGDVLAISWDGKKWKTQQMVRSKR